VYHLKIEDIRFTRGQVVRPEANRSIVRRNLLRGLHTHPASGKAEWDANEEKVVITFGVDKPTDFGFRQIKLAWRNN